MSEKKELGMETMSAPRSFEHDEDVYLSSDEERRMNEVFRTDDLRNAFKNLVVTSRGEPYISTAIQYKRDIVLEIASDHLPSKEILREQPSIYIASGVDIAFPLCLGARKIMMVDIAFKEDPEALDIVVDRIIQITSRQPTSISDAEISFLFDFGDGTEEVCVSFHGAYYIPYPRRDANIPLYKMPEHAGMVLQFLSQRTDLHDDMLKNVIVPGGILLCDRTPDYRDQADLNFEWQKDESINELYSDESSGPVHYDFDKIYELTYRKRGYRYIPLHASPSSKDFSGIFPVLLKRLS